MDLLSTYVGHEESTGSIENRPGDEEMGDDHLLSKSNIPCILGGMQIFLDSEASNGTLSTGIRLSED